MRYEINNSMSYAEYKELIDRLVAEGKTTGPIQTEAKADFTRLNRQRSSRVERTVEIGERLRSVVRGIERPMTWLVVSEAWCGDGAQSVPVVEKIAAENDKIETRYLLRDENLGLLEELQGKLDLAIPKVIAIDTSTSEVLGIWGSRPAAAQQLFAKLKAEGVEKDMILEEMQRWHNTDRGQSLQREFEKLVVQWDGGRAAAAAG